MTKRMIIMLLAVGIVLGGVFGFQAFKARMIAQFMAGNIPVMTVAAVPAPVSEWRGNLRAVGTLRAIQGADLAAEVGGVVEAIHFESGRDVEAGELLVTMRNAEDLAQLRALESTAALARLTAGRSREAVKTSAVSQARVDQDEAALKNAEAQLAQQRALVEKKTIRAPFAGRVGIRRVDVGQFVSPGTIIVTLQSVNDIYIDFYLPQQQLSQVEVGKPVSVTADTYPGETFTGEVIAISPRVDAASRNIEVRALLKNPDNKLLSGMFASVTLEVGEPQQFVTLPQTAITYNPYGNTVYVVSEDGKTADGKPKLVARQSFVTVGDTRGDQVAVTSGITEGTTVVVAGQVKLQNGMQVLINNEVMPKNDANPRPIDG